MNNMNNRSKKGKNYGLLLISLIFSVIFIFPAIAFEGAVLKEIIIGSKDNYSYKVILKTNKDVPVEKYTTSDNRIVIDLKNTRTAEYVNTIYDNTPEISNVFVQSLAKNKVRIFIEGLNIASSKIILDTRNIPTVIKKQAPVLPINTRVSSSAAEKIKTGNNNPVINLSNNISEITHPVTNNNPVISYQNNFSAGNNTQNEIIEEAATAGITLKQIFGKEGFDWLIRVFAMIFIIIGIIKLLNKSKNITLNLSTENAKEQETNLYQSAYDKKELLTKSLGAGLSERIKAKKNQYSTNTNYGIKEYQNSNNRPVRQKSDRPSDNINTRLNRAERLNSALKTTKPPTATKRPIAGRMKATQRDTKTAEGNFDNVKFLETMATIYQKSGRTDLAKNVRNNLIKNKAS